MADEVAGRGDGGCRVINGLEWVAGDRWLLKRGRSVHVANVRRESVFYPNPIMSALDKRFARCLEQRASQRHRWGRCGV